MKGTIHSSCFLNININIKTNNIIVYIAYKPDREIFKISMLLLILIFKNFVSVCIPTV